MNHSPAPSIKIGGCQASVFLGAGQPLELRSFPLPNLDAGEALVRIECCTICGSDLHTVQGARTELTPSILGHEIIGVIASIGNPPPHDIDGIPLSPGDRITWSTSVSCGTCDRCHGGLPQKCRTLAKYGHELAEGKYALSGGLAEYLLLRRGSTAIRITGKLPAEVICPVNCATATIAAAYRTAGPIAGRRVFIFGAGMLGLTAAAVARSNGASTIAICDVNAKRLERASQFGVDSAMEWHSERNEFRQRLHRGCGTDLFDLILELSGSPDAVEMAIHLGDVGARVVLVGSVMKSRPALIDPESVVRRWLSVHGVHNYCPTDLRSAVTFLERFGAAYPFAELVEHTYSLTELNTAMETAIRTRPVRIAVRP